MAELQKSSTATFRMLQSNPEPEEPPRPVKRARVTLACQRCKARKQKSFDALWELYGNSADDFCLQCDGAHPACSKCKAHKLPCKYIIPNKPMPFGKNHYIKALENKIAELKSYIRENSLQLQSSQDDVQDVQNSPHCPSALQDSNPHSPETETWQPQEENTTNITEDTYASENDDNETFGSQKGLDSMVDVLRDLSLDANGGYIGASSHVNIGKLISSIINSGRSKDLTGNSHVQDSRNVRLPTLSLGIGQECESFGFSDVPADVADRLVIEYMKHISHRWPILQSSWIQKLHLRRDTIDNVFEKSTLHLIYAIGGWCLETTGKAGGFYPEKHHAVSLRNLDGILQFHDTRAIQTLLLLAIYCLRAPTGPGAWFYVRLAMLICIDLGLHRRTTSQDRPSLNAEMKKRLFWSCYCFDRQMSISLGRPFAISDRDIDAELPLDIDEAADDMKSLERTSQVDLSIVPMTSTTLSSFVHVLKLRQIESNIQQNIYRVDRSGEASAVETDYFLEQLSRWRSMIPLDIRKKANAQSITLDGYDFYILKPTVDPRFLRTCAQACVGICQIYKRLYQNTSVGCSMEALQTVLLAGLTLIYCTWISPEIFNNSTSNDIDSCNIVLIFITERLPGTKKYQNAFELAKNKVIDSIADGSHQKPQEAIGALTPDLRSTLDSFEVGDDGREELSRMMHNMAGIQKGAELALAQAASAGPQFYSSEGPLEFPHLGTQFQFNRVFGDHMITGLEMTGVRFPQHDDDDNDNDSNFSK
ncbi:MAG: hypothetical protein M1834_002156 [Cirrosporium novae-zelandiae]|nr:MAG: hypothetical protein M1834_002156 [Cirrosporium novae-zelandiae]